jgi:hypothetical protein
MQRALDAVFAMLTECQDGRTGHFPPTELFSEGWMLRLLLREAANGRNLLPFHLEPTADWYSEARLASPFMRQPGEMKGEIRAEGFTNADGVVGQFDMRADTRAGLELRSDATQFVVVEAKMASGLSKGTRYAAGYDQAARNVACMAWTLRSAGVRPDRLKNVGFFVLAPQTTHDRFRIPAMVQRESIQSKIEDRVATLGVSEPRRKALEQWLAEWLDPLLDRLVEQSALRSLSWETILDGLDPSEDLVSFYARCLEFNRPVSRAAPRE